MVSKRLGAIVVGLLTVVACPAAVAETTGLGKIMYTQGHSNPSCRTVAFKETASGAVIYFSISAVQGKDDVAAMVLAALISNRDVQIYYVPGQTSGCGTEPAINYITVF